MVRSLLNVLYPRLTVAQLVMKFPAVCRLCRFFKYHVHWALPLDPCLRQVGQIYTLTLCCLNKHFIICIRSSKVLSSFQVFKLTFATLMRLFLCALHASLPDLVIITIFNSLKGKKCVNRFNYKRPKWSKVISFRHVLKN